MKGIRITESLIAEFEAGLKSEEKSAGTREKYIRDITAFSRWLDGREASKETAIEWKDRLLQDNYAPVTVNSMISSVNCFFRFCEIPAKIKFVRIQKNLFREKSRELTKEEFLRLVETAELQGKKRLSLLMETLCATGIRVSEIKYITLEAARMGMTTVSLKGKVRTIMLPAKLCRKLIKYAKKEKIASGEIFLTGNGRSMSRGQIWTEMKRLSKSAGVEATKIFPHNLRHLFAATFYRIYKDVVKLADVLGHSSIETTRIYLASTGEEHRQMLEQMRLVL